MPGSVVMDNCTQEDARVGDAVAEDDGTWGGVEENINDPEEIRVIFCALDSFL